MAPITGRKVLIFMVGAFSLIIGVNLYMAYSAIRTFPGVEAKSSYQVSQSFQADRAAQLALGWDVGAAVSEGELILSIVDGTGQPVAPEITSATFGRATSVRDDQSPDFAFDGQVFRAPVTADGGNWNLRLVALASDGTQFRQRIIVPVN